jgi:23S rRNA pseudouridine1911/1915/1917 synthase
MHGEIIEIQVPHDKAKERIDVFLARALPRVTRSQIQKMIKAGLVTIAGVDVKANHLVRSQERIQVVIRKPPSNDLIPQRIPLSIVHEDEYLIVVNKPAGMVVHPAYGHPDGTLVNALLAHCHSLAHTGSPLRPGIVHRLDKDTSGLIVIAKDEVIHAHLAKQFHDKTVDREYISIAWGRFKKRSGRIETIIGRSNRDRRKMSVAKQGKIAVTHFSVMEQYQFLALLKLNLETGRTHQIRVHLAHINHPVFGDQNYGGRTKQTGGLNQNNLSLAMALLKGMTRQALHAKTIGFIHPITGDNLQFDSKIPDDMLSTIEALRSDSL